MAALKNYKKVGAPFPNCSEIVRVVYDFAQDGGIANATDVLGADGAIVIKHFHLKVLETCTGTGATLDIGVSGNSDILAKAIPVASLVAGYFAAPVTEITLSEGTPNTAVMVDPLPLKLADLEKILMETNTAAFTAGKIELVFEVCKF